MFPVSVPRAVRSVRARLRRAVRFGPVLACAAAVLLSVIAALPGVPAPGAIARTAVRTTASPRPSASGTSTPAPTPTPTPAAPAWQVSVLGGGPGYGGVARWSVPAIATSQLATGPADAAPAVLPSGGRLGSVTIPATVSRFTARSALVYLPPAALVPHPRRLPVVIMFSGQSRGSGPLDVERSGHLTAMVDRIAQAHHGFAPIVVVPDQLGPGSPNPMCVDSAMGQVATYITQDVRSWIQQHLPVAADRTGWSIAGFSQGGTCAIQFAAGYPQYFGSFVDVSGQLAPTNGSLANTIAVGFGGSRSRYEAATPTQLLSSGRQFAPMQGYFAVGELDTRYGPVAPILRRQAAAAGIEASLHLVPRIRHSWTVGAAGLEWGLTQLTARWDHV